MILSDKDIRELIEDQRFNNEPPMIDPFIDFSVRDSGTISYGLTHAGYDLRLGNEFLVFKNTFNETIDPKRFGDADYCARVFDRLVTDKMYIAPHSYVLATSVEHLRIPANLKGRCVGKSTYARSGLLVNVTPLEPGWRGRLTIELGNVTPCPLVVYAGEGIAQIEFYHLNSVPSETYESKGGKYMGQETVTVARMG